jgi:biotin transport system permease protein
VSGTSLVGVHRPGSSVLHRLPAGVKLLGLAAFSLTVVLGRGLPLAALGLAVAATLTVVARLPLGLLWRAGRPLLLAAVVVAGLQWWVDGLARAAETLLDLVTLALAALAVSATTPVNALLDTLVRALGPLRRVGVDPDRVALAFGLAIGALPGTLALAVETRDAARARGLRTPRAYLTPFVIRVVARAHETGDALHARGVGDD